MVRGWFTLRVQLVSGGGIEMKHPPGRKMLVGPHHTFKDLAEAIDLAFARWDRSHLHEFEFPDGTRYGVPDADFDPETIDYAAVRAGKAVSKGMRFTYIFDLGDNWVHECRAEKSNVNPYEVAGIEPLKPIPVWGWGWIPDQYGRRWDGDTGEGEVAFEPDEEE